MREIELEKNYPKKKRAKPRKFPDVRAPRLVCFHLEKGNVCRFIANDPIPCKSLCPNWCTFNAKFIRKWGKSKHKKREYMDWSNLMQTPKYKHLLVRSKSLKDKDVAQTTMGYGYEED